MILLLVFFAGFCVGFIANFLLSRFSAKKKEDSLTKSSTFVDSVSGSKNEVSVLSSLPKEKTAENSQVPDAPKEEPISNQEVENAQPTSVPRDSALEDKASLTERLLRENLDKWIVSGGYLNQGMTLEELAAELMTNRTYLSGYINNTYNCTFKEFIYMLRIEAAIQIMMEDPSISVEDLGTKVGIPSASTFNRQFVKQMGVTPAVWKMSNLQKMG